MPQPYIGLVRLAAGTPTPADVDAARARGIIAPPELTEKVSNLPASLPDTCTIVAAYLVGAPDLVSVLVVEAEGQADLTFINDYYAGWLQFEWHPTNEVPRA